MSHSTPMSAHSVCTLGSMGMVMVFSQGLDTTNSPPSSPLKAGLWFWTSSSGSTMARGRVHPPHQYSVPSELHETWNCIKDCPLCNEKHGESVTLKWHGPNTVLMATSISCSLLCMYMVDTAFYDNRHIVCNIHVCTCKPISEFHSPDFDVQKIPRAHLPTPHLHSL